MTDAEICAALAGVTLHGWVATWQHPGFIEFYHPLSSVMVVCTSDWEVPDTLDVQLQGANDFDTIEGGAVLHWRRDRRSLVEFCALISPLLARVIADFRDGVPSTKHGQPFYYCQTCETANEGNLCCEYQGDR